MTKAVRRIGAVASTLAGTVGAGTALSLGGLLPTLLLLAAAGMAALTLFVPDTVTLFGISALYMNLPGIAVNLYRMPVLLAGSAFLLLLMPFLSRYLLRRDPIIVDYPLLLIVAFLGAVLVSFLVVKDYQAAFGWLGTFMAEGLMMYFLVLNLIRTPRNLTRVIDVLMLCGALLAGLTVYQQATKSFSQQFFGLAQRNIEFVDGGDALHEPDKMRLVERAGGPLGQPNRYAQNLLYLLPLVFYRMRSHKKALPRLICAGCGLVILGGTLLTFSRGAFIGLAAVVLLLALMKEIRLRELALVGAVAVMGIVVFAPSYVGRIATLAGVTTDVRDARSGEMDGAIRGRLTEMLAAFSLFLDHPLIGVGAGQFMPVYSQDYMSDPDIAFRHVTTERRAHIMYFEMAAETGILGLGIFLAVIALMQMRLWRAWHRWRKERPELGGLAAAFFLSICSYLVTAIFLQLAYQRYFWLLLGLAGAAVQILTAEDRRSRIPQEAPA